MKKQLIVSSAIILLTSISQAYLVPGNHGDGIPNNVPLHDQNPYTPQQPVPPHHNHGGYHPSPVSVVGPARTVRFEDRGTAKVDKVLSETVRIDVQGRLVNEIVLRATRNPAEIRSIEVKLIDGGILRLPAGTVGRDQTVTLRLDPRFSLRVHQIRIQAVSPIIIGPSSRLNTILGLAE